MAARQLDPIAFCDTSSQNSNKIKEMIKLTRQVTIFSIPALFYLTI